ncbi:hypothetical protein [uncultured Polaribacter sp.]|uniref:hypothetical protein n=1 Tax=uncultured Polaribacter sp. TaxID=174711 RepID=UPI002631A354|nr:hypothetical protein [uncultured Polaribacter sp.]
MKLITVGTDVVFEDKSSNVASREWTFVGGDISTSTEKEVTVNYADEGTFLAKLAVVYEDGSTQNNGFNIDVYPEVIADFTASSTVALQGSKIMFTNTTQHITSAFDDSKLLDGYEWFFEGGVPESSTLANPEVTYAGLGYFSVKLIAKRQAPYYIDENLKEDYIFITDVPSIAPAETRLRFLGSVIELTYTEDLKPLTQAEKDLVSVKINDAAVDIASIDVDSNDSKKLIVSLMTSASEGDNIILNINAGIVSKSGTPLSPLRSQPIENTIVNLYKELNPSFENGNLGSFPTDWGNWNPTAGKNNPESYAIGNTVVQDGNKSLEIHLDGTSQNWILDSKFATTELSARYRFSVWAKGTVGKIDLDLRAVTPNWADVQSIAAPLTTEWKEYVIEFEETNENLNRKYWQQLSSATTQTIYIDNVSLYRID